MHDPPTVLLIDDDREVLRGVSLRLRAAGLNVICANDGPQGLNLAHREKPDAIILDIRMPGMDGWTVLTRLQDLETTASIPAVVLSASIQDQSHRRARDLGAQYFLSKPYDPKELIETVQAAVAMGTGSSRP